MVQAEQLGFSDPRFERCLHIRRVVFIEEQQVPWEEEVDGKDPSAVHFLAWDSEIGDLGTARMRMVEAGHAKAERVAVHQFARKRGVGRVLMATLEEAAREAGAHEVTLAAQMEALPFYERLGYVARGDVFMDAGIPHRWMDKALRG